MRTYYFTILLLFSFGIAACNRDDNDPVPPTPKNTLNLQMNGLEDVGPNHRYEGWIIVNGTPKSTGTFQVNSSGELSQKQFTVNESDLQSASEFVLTLEPYPDSDPAPSMVKILAGNFSNSNATLNTGVIGNFSSATGKYILATPTTTETGDEKSVVWFIDNSSGMQPGLNLPALPAGWKYEGWTVINGNPITTGTFSDGNMADANAATSPFKGNDGNGPMFPGEDYIMNAPQGLMFPTMLNGSEIVITIEPMPDNSPMPFFLKPLKHTVPANAMPMELQMMMNNAASLPAGTASR